MDELPFLVVLIRKIRAAVIWIVAAILAILLIIDYMENEEVASILTSVLIFLFIVIFLNYLFKNMNKKITHEIKIQKSVLIALYAILVVLSLNLVSPFFKVGTASAFSNEVHKIAICHPVHFTRCAEIKDGVLMAGFYN